MKASKFSDAQKAFILKQGSDGIPVAEICRRAGISQATYFNWKKKYDGLLPAEMKRLKQLEDENGKLRKLVADLSLDKEMLRHSPKTVRPGRKRELVAETCDEWNVSIRRACRVLEFDTSTYHYKFRRRDQAGIEARIKDICATRVRYGYRRAHVMLTRERCDINMKVTYRILQGLGPAAQEQDAEAACEGRSCGKAGRKPSARTTSGRWTSPTISSRRARRSMC